MNGRIEVFYPQGVLIGLSKYDAIGIADYDECKRIAPTVHLTIGLSIRAKVVGFDEVNNWIILDVIELPHKEITGR